MRYALGLSLGLFTVTFGIAFTCYMLAGTFGSIQLYAQYMSAASAYARAAAVALLAASLTATAVIVRGRL